MTSSIPAAEVSALSFEQAVEELEKIVAALERGEALKKHCETLLNAAENRIEKIRIDRAGNPQGVEPLDNG